jgi:hypothetical protein
MGNHSEDDGQAVTHRGGGVQLCAVGVVEAAVEDRCVGGVEGEDGGGLVVALTHADPQAVGGQRAVAGPSRDVGNAQQLVGLCLHRGRAGELGEVSLAEQPATHYHRPGVGSAPDGAPGVQRQRIELWEPVVAHVGGSLPAPGEPIAQRVAVADFRRHSGVDAVGLGKREHRSSLAAGHQQGEEKADFEARATHRF